jgi:transposase-like protein
MTSKTTNKFSLEVRERAVQLVFDHEADHSSRWTACQSIAAKIGCSAHTLLDWVKRAEWPAAGFVDTEIRCFNGTGELECREGRSAASSSSRR